GPQQLRTVVPADAGRSAGSSPIAPVSVFKVGITGVKATGNEYVTIKNKGTVAVELEGWTLRTKSGHATLPEWSLAPGDTLRIHPGNGTSQGHDLYLGVGAMLGNRHDVVKLTDSAGLRAAQFSY